MARLRLAVDVTPLLGHRTGIGVFTHEVVSRLATAPDVELHAFSVSWRGRTAIRTELPAGARLTSRPMAAQPLRTLWSRFDLPPVEWWTGPVDVVFGPNYVVPPARRAAELVTVHDLTVVHSPELCTADTLTYPHLLRRAFDRGAHVHTDSAFVAGEVTDTFGLPPDRVHVVHLGVSALPATAPGEGAHLAGADRFVLALGTVEPRKGLPTLLQAFDRVADEDDTLHLVVAGPDGWGAEAFESARQAARHRARITRLARHVADRERAALLRDASVFAFPSVYEGFGLPPLEAMAAGTPVVATRTGSLPEVLGDAAEWCAVGDVDGLASALDRVLRDADRRDDLVRRGTDQADRFSWDRTAAQLLDLCRALADPVRSGR